MARKTITISELAKYSGLSRIFIGDCLKGNTNPKPATIGRIAAALNVDVTEIIQTESASSKATTQ